MAGPFDIIVNSMTYWQAVAAMKRQDAPFILRRSGSGQIHLTVQKKSGGVVDLPVSIRDDAMHIDQSWAALLAPAAVKALMHEPLPRENVVRMLTQATSKSAPVTRRNSFVEISREIVSLTRRRSVTVTGAHSDLVAPPMPTNIEQAMALNLEAQAKRSVTEIEDVPGEPGPTSPDADTFDNDEMLTMPMRRRRIWRATSNAPPRFVDAPIELG